LRRESCADGPLRQLPRARSRQVRSWRPARRHPARLPTSNRDGSRSAVRSLSWRSSARPGPGEPRRRNRGQWSDLTRRSTTSRPRAGRYASQATRRLWLTRQGCRSAQRHWPLATRAQVPSPGQPRESVRQPTMVRRSRRERLVNSAENRLIGPWPIRDSPITDSSHLRTRRSSRPDCPR